MNVEHTHSIYIYTYKNIFSQKVLEEEIVGGERETGTLACQRLRSEYRARAGAPVS